MRVRFPDLFKGEKGGRRVIATDFNPDYRD